MFQHLFPEFLSTLWIYGLMPMIAEAIGLSRVSTLKEIMNTTTTTSQASILDQGDRNRDFLNLSEIKIGDLEQMTDQDPMRSRISPKKLIGDPYFFPPTTNVQ